MGKNIKYGEFTFNKPNPRPTVKGYSFGGEAEPTATQAPALSARKAPAPSPAPTMSPAQKLAMDNKTFISKLNAADGKQRLIDPDAMNAAVQRRDYVAKTQKARLAQEAKQNAIPSKSPYRQDAMNQEKSRLLPSPARAPAMKKGGEVQGYAFGGIAEFLSKAKAEGLLGGQNSQPSAQPSSGLFSNVIKAWQNRDIPAQAPNTTTTSPPPATLQGNGSLGSFISQLKSNSGNIQPATGSFSNLLKSFANQAPQATAPKSGNVGNFGNFSKVLQGYLKQRNGTLSGFKEGGSVSKGKAKSMESSSKDKAQDKAMIKKAMKQHDQQEHKGGKGTVLALKKGSKAPVKGVKLVGMKREPEAVVKKEISLLKKAGAPAKMIKHEEIEAVSPMNSMGGMRKGGAAMKKGVPTFNRTPKC